MITIPDIQAPEFCPNPACRYYHREQAAAAQWFYRHGSFHTRARGSVPRFRCRSCGKCCSTQTFSIHYWTHANMDLLWLLEHLNSGSGLRQIGRFAGVVYRVIQNRIRRMARNALSAMDLLLDELQLGEDLAMDGFESFCRSKYHPNNITTVVGADSQLIYALIYTALRRKGAMTPAQEAMRAHIDEHWRPDPKGVEHDCAALLGDLGDLIADACRRRGSVRLATDKHAAYPPALASVGRLQAELTRGRLEHHQTSSRAARTPGNPLFPVNYVDRQIRKNCGEHTRRTVKHGREVNCQMERMALFQFAHNFLTPHRIDNRAYTGDAPRHASMIGLHSPEVALRVGRALTHRHLFGHRKRTDTWIERIWRHGHANPPRVALDKDGSTQVRSVALPPGALPKHLLA